MAKVGILATSVPDIKFWCANLGVIFFLLCLELCTGNISN